VIISSASDHCANNELADLVSYLPNTYPNAKIIVATNKSNIAKLHNLVSCNRLTVLDSDHINENFFIKTIQEQFDVKHTNAPTVNGNHFDKLTGLGNRDSIFEYLTNTLQACTPETQVTLYYINCDNFSVINESLGFHSGDLFLSSFANLLRPVIHHGNYAARITADEFLVIMTNEISSQEYATQFARDILQSCRNGIYLSTGECLDAHCSIGITQYHSGRGHVSTEDLIQESRIAVRSVKNKGGNDVAVFHSDLGRKAARRIQLLNNIRNAFRRREFYLNYQPIMEAANDRVQGFEALLRWQLPNGERIPPNEFIPILEETGMIHILGGWVISQACHDLAELIKCGVINHTHWISVNVSPLQLMDTSFPDKVKQALVDSQLKPNQLHIELTESSLMENSEFTLSVLSDIKKVGCQLSLDDFGVGYSSMNYLKILPIDTLKIDQSFIRTYDGEQSDKAIIRTMVSLAHNLKKKVIAEGVETKLSANFLKQRRCDYLQGFLYAKPMSLSDVSQFTESKNQPIKTVK
jgi:diguanylate cyclase (GGDEF)-like protein